MHQYALCRYYPKDSATATDCKVEISSCTFIKTICVALLAQLQLAIQNMDPTLQRNNLFILKKNLRRSLRAIL